MADWSDVSNLWWLRPRQESPGPSALQAFQVGANIRQNQIENEIRFKTLALQNQYRQDQLAMENRRVDALIDSYDEKARHQEEVQNDMGALTEWGNARQQGKDVPLNLTTPEGMRMHALMLNALARQNIAKQESATEIGIDEKYRAKLNSIGRLNDVEFTRLRTALKENEFKWTPELMDDVNATLNSLTTAGPPPAPPGMEVGSYTPDTPGAGKVTFVRPRQEFRAGETKEQFKARRIGQLKQAANQAVAAGVPGAKPLSDIQAAATADNEWDLAHEKTGDMEQYVPEPAGAGLRYKRVDGKLQLVK